MMKRLLVIEDDQDILDILVYVLQHDGYEVFASGGNAVIKEVETIKPDLILLDEWLDGDQKGSDLCRLLRAGRQTASIPVIILSAFNPVEYVVSKARADGYIKKPFNIDELRPAVEAVLVKQSDHSDSFSGKSK